MELIITIAIATYLRKTFRTRTNLPEWHRVLGLILYGAIALLVITVSFKKAAPVTKWFVHALLLYLLYTLYSQEVFDKAKRIVVTVAPFILLTVLEDILKLIVPARYSGWQGWIKTATAFSIIWMVVMWVMTSRQRKELEKERIKTKNEEEQKKLMESMNDQLEIQVQERTAELTRQKEELQHTLEELKSTQSQLIQSEKMASLGQLTAGIAHEIQNPLNFVNNFSELNKEMLEELKMEITKPADQQDESLENELIGDIINNSEKINYHGKRADGIVKSMLQHSRASSGTKVPIDINALCDEYLRLAFHGTRAIDKTFNSGMETILDPSLSANDAGEGKINVVPQDLGRVLLNLLTNAFYEVNEKRKSGSQDYQPMVKIKTLRSGQNVIIEVSDNGRGISDDLQKKIFQPFFTTKPTGKGTGLGLSLSYDIIKAHGGEISVNSVPGESTIFKIVLPVN